MSENPVFHEGETEIHERLGLRESMLEKGGSMVNRQMSFALQIFYHLQNFVFVGSVDRDGFPWSSIVCGQPGFLKALNATSLRVGAERIAGDPLADNLKVGSAVGTLAMEFDNRLRRGRVNGRVSALTDDSFVLAVSQAYSNCGKYIQQRREEAPCAASARVLSRGAALTAAQAWRIALADTFFLSSYFIGRGDAPSHGVDISHRGGAPGFVQVDGDRELVFPDYRGNMAFNSLGNMLKNPRAGLLFMDFERGHTLQLTGEATIDWQSARLAEFPGATGLVSLRVRDVVELADVVPFRWSFLKHSPSNPRRDTRDA